MHWVNATVSDREKVYYKRRNKAVCSSLIETSGMIVVARSIGLFSVLKEDKNVLTSDNHVRT